jgi:hypothetical protein
MAHTVRCQRITGITAIHSSRSSGQLGPCQQVVCSARVAVDQHSVDQYI